jgi:hypothetical protein
VLFFKCFDARRCEAPERRRREHPSGDGVVTASWERRVRWVMMYVCVVSGQMSEETGGHVGVWVVTGLGVWAFVR